MQYRNELKFILNLRTAELIRRRISGVMAADAHALSGIYTVNNIYFDDRYDTFLNEKQIGSFNRDKFRVRYYNDDLSFICFENKHKDGSLAYKEKTRITNEELAALKAGDFSFAACSGHPLWQKVVSIHNARRLRPAAAFSYTREAYVYPHGDVRITFDSSIRAQDAVSAAYTGTVFAANPLLELKYTGFLPSLIADMLHGLPLTRTEMSKYCIMRNIV